MFGIHPGSGIIVIQSGGNAGWISVGLTMLRYGTAAQTALFALLAGRQVGQRQHLMLMDAHGQMVAYTGEKYGSRNAHLVTPQCAILGTRISNPNMLNEMHAAWEKNKGDLSVRLISALKAAFKADGQRSGFRSAVLKIISNEGNAPEWSAEYDLRVDDYARPVDELQRLAYLRAGYILDREGHHLLAEGQVNGALLKWKHAREQLPDKEEVCFWQAVALADSDPASDRMNLAGRILATVLKSPESMVRWQTFIHDLQEAGLIQHRDVPERLIKALEEA